MGIGWPADDWQVFFDERAGIAENVVRFDCTATQGSMFESTRTAIDNGMKYLTTALDALVEHYGI